MQIDWGVTRVRLNCVGRSMWRRGVAVSPYYRAAHPRSDHTLCYYFKGSGRITVRGRWVGLEPGVCVWMRSGDAYDIRQDRHKPVGATFIHFDLIDASGRLRDPAAPLPPEVIFPAAPKFVEQATARITDLVLGTGWGYAWAPPEGPVRQTATSLLTSVLMDLDRGSGGRVANGPGSAAAVKPKQRELIAELAAKLAEEPGELPTVAEMARRMGYSAPTSRGSSVP